MAQMMASRGTAMKSWLGVFPDFTTLEGSCLFIKKLIAVSMSAITYFRGIFPEKAYGDKNLNGLMLKILTETSDLKSVQKFINLVRNCYDAVDKKYLQQMSFGVVPNPEKRDDVVEVYSLEFRYKDDECSISRNNEKKKLSLKKDDPTIQATILMLKSIMQINDILGPLPDKPYLTVKLLYYDDVTPSDYEPEGFGPGKKLKFDFIGKTSKIELGKIDSNNHGYRLFLKTTLGLTSPSDQSMLRASQSYMEDTIRAECCQEGKDKCTHKPTLEEPVTPRLPQKSQSGKTVSDARTKAVLQCPCECETDDQSNVIICMSCGNEHHRVCYALLEPKEIPEVFYCVNCFLGNTDGSANNDLIYSVQGNERKILCIMRRALTLCLTLKTVGNNILEKKLGCSKAEAENVMKRLESERFVQKFGKTKFTVLEHNIKEFGFDNYFPDKENIDSSNMQQDYFESEMDEGIADSLTNRKESPQQELEEVSSTDFIEESINQVKSLCLHKPMKKSMARHYSPEDIFSPVKKSPDSMPGERKISVSNGAKIGSSLSLSRKRKYSESHSMMSPNQNSEELFQSTSFKAKKHRKGSAK